MPSQFPSGDAPPLVHNGFSALSYALHAHDPGLSYDYFMGMTGGAWLTCHGEEEGRPLWLAETMRYLPAGLKRLGYTAEVTDQATFEARYGEDTSKKPRRNVAAVRLNSTHAEILSTAVTNDQVWIPVSSARSRSCGRRRREDWTYILARPDSTPKGLRSFRQWSALADGVATLFRPPFLTTTVDGQPAEAAVGIATSDLWRKSLQTGPSQQVTLHAQAEMWKEARGTGAAFLFYLAGNQRTAYANRLRRAAELFDREVVSCLTPLTVLPRRSADQQAPALLNDARQLVEDAAHLLAEAVFIALQIPLVAAEALLQPPDHPLNGMPLQEVLYLARAGTTPLRLLAARRLAGSDRPQVVSTLVQLLYESDYRVRQTAVWSLKEINPPGLVRILGSALRSDAPETAALARLHLLALGTAEAESILAEWHAAQTATAASE